MAEPLLVDAQGGTLVEQRTPVVGVLLPSRGWNLSEFTLAFADLIALTCMTAVARKAFDFRILRRSGTYIDMNRCDLIKEVLLDEDVTHVFWLDDDMTFPKDALIRLWNHQAPIVGTNYSRRRMPLEPVAIRSIEQREKVWDSPDKHGLERVDAIGLGCALIERRVFEAIEYPWMYEHYDFEKKRWVGEDVDFCVRAAAAGFPTLIDHDLSNELEHFGTKGWTLEHARAFKMGRDGVDTALAELKEKVELDLAGLQE
jgi:hypothetical protein